MSSIQEKPNNLLHSRDISSKLYTEAKIDKYIQLAKKADLSKQVQANLNRKTNELVSKVKLTEKTKVEDLGEVNPHVLVHAVKNKLVTITGPIKVSDEGKNVIIGLSNESHDFEESGDSLSNAATEVLSWLNERDAIDVCAINKDILIELLQCNLVCLEGSLVITDEGKEASSKYVEEKENEVDNEDDGLYLDEYESNDSDNEEELDPEESMESFFGRAKNYFQDIKTRRKYIQNKDFHMDNIRKHIQELTQEVSKVSDLKESNSKFKMDKLAIFGMAIGHKDIITDPNKWDKLIDILDNFYSKANTHIFRSISNDTDKMTSIINKFAQDTKNKDKYIKEFESVYSQVTKKLLAITPNSFKVDLTSGKSASVKASEMLPTSRLVIYNDLIQYPKLQVYNNSVDINIANRITSTGFLPIDKSGLDKLIKNLNRINELLDVQIKVDLIINKATDSFVKSMDLIVDIKENSLEREVISSITDMGEKLRSYLLSIIEVCNAGDVSVYNVFRTHYKYIKHTLNRY